MIASLRTKHAKLLFAFFAAVGITTGAFFLASHLTESGSLGQFVAGSGIFGAIAIAFVSGLNFVVPVPPATFAPIFIESGVNPYLVVIGFVIGTTIADSIGYLLGWVGRGSAETNHPKLAKRLHEFMTQHTHLVLPLAFIYFAVAPLPNEIILIPLALSGYRYRDLLIPMIAGTIIHHPILVFGYQSVFNYLF